jgi:hypothetical protein
MKNLTIENIINSIQEQKVRHKFMINKSQFIKIKNYQNQMYIWNNWWLKTLNVMKYFIVKPRIKKIRIITKQYWNGR